jgi:hypothetical protein
VIEWVHTPEAQGTAQWENWTTRIPHPTGKHVMVIRAYNPDKYVQGDPVTKHGVGYYILVSWSWDGVSILPLDTPIEDVKAAAIAIARLSGGSE